MATKTVDSDLLIHGGINFNGSNNIILTALNPAWPGGLAQLFLGGFGQIHMGRVKDYVTMEQGYVRYILSSSVLKSFCEDNECHASLGENGLPWVAVYSKKFIVPNGTAAQFLKADGSLDSNSYALHTDLNAVKNNAWKLDIANPECETVVIALQPGQGIFEAMEKAGIDYLKSRNIYVDLSAAGEWSGENIFAGYEKAPIGVRYHIFFGNVKTAIKLYWASSIESNKLSGNLALTAEYPTAKCEFMRVTDSWTYADWEALIDEVSHVIDTGTASESENSTLMNYMDNNKVSYAKTAKGALVNLTALLAALAGNSK